MAEVKSVRTLGEDDVLAISGAAGEVDWLRDRRLEAFKAFLDLPWPGPRDEEWRYTNPSRFSLDRPVVVEVGDAPAEQAPELSSLIGGLERTAARARLVDGGLAEVVVGHEAAEAGVVVTTLAQAASSHPEVLAAALGAGVGTDEKFDALNLAAFTASLLVYVPREVELADPIAVTVQVDADGTHLPRILVVLERHAKAVVYVDHVGEAQATVVEAVESVLGEASRLDLVTAQHWGDGVDHLGSHRGKVGHGASYRHLEVSLGGRTLYLRPDVRLDAEGADGELLGVYFCDEGQQVEHRSLIHHNASRTSSNLVYKGALQGESRSTFFGNIRIEEHARGTSSDQTNRNLILTDGAKADSIPFLEILNSDVVRCGHHSSVGQIDELQLFYLESRGIPREEAARLLVFAFFAEVVERIDLPGVTDAVLAELEEEVRSGPTTTMNQRRS